MIKKYLKKDIYLQNKDKNVLIIWDWNNSIIMEYQKMINLLDNTPNQPTKFRTKNLSWDKWWITWSVNHGVSLVVKLNFKLQY